MVEALDPLPSVEIGVGHGTNVVMTSVTVVKKVDVVV